MKFPAGILTSQGTKGDRIHLSPPKSVLMNHPVLQLVDAPEAFHIYTDANDLAIGADEQVQHPVA